MPTSTQRLLPLVLILLAYAVIGTLFATRVPAWQTPDEPAHYAYIRQVAETGALPVIEPADWSPNTVPIGPTNRDVPVERISYEDHQPPLFYVLAVPVFNLSGGNLIALRLFSLAVGGLGIVFAYLAILTLFSAQPVFATALAAFGTAFIALLPQHVHLLAGLNNDSLSEALIALTVLLCLRLIVRPGDAPERGAGPLVGPLLIGLGVVVGLAMLTKAQAYLALPVAAVGLLLARQNPALRTRRISLQMVGALVLGVVIAAPLWLRNIGLYGGLDFLGLQRHNVVVVGQPTTAGLIAAQGVAGWLRELLQTTFQSYWAQFGWMSIPLSGRFYLVFLAFSVLSLSFFAIWLLRANLRAAENMAQRRGLLLLGALALFSLLGFIWYNTQFVQFQGRYLYPALIPAATALALGWHAVLPRLRALLWPGLTLILAALDLYLLFRVILPQMAAG